MKFKSILISLILLTTFACSSGDSSIFDLGKVNKGPVVVKVNDLEVHQGLLDLLSEMNPRVKAQLTNPLTKKKILDSLIDQQLLYQEAVKRGLHNTEDVVIKSLLNKNVIISNALVEKELEDAMKKSYEEKKATQFTKVPVSIIGKHFENKDAKKGPSDKAIQDTLSAVKELKKKIDKGDDFATLAKEHSDDKMTQKKGGVAGQISNDDKRFKRLGLGDLVGAAFKLKKGEVSEPIKTKRGYYIVKVTDEPIVVSFDEAKRVLGFELQSKIKKNLIDGLRNSAKIEFALSGNEKKTEKNNVVPVKKPKNESKKDK